METSDNDATESDPMTQRLADLELSLKTWTTNLLNIAFDNFHKELEHVRTEKDLLEQQLALMLQSYAEVGAVVQSLIATKLDEDSVGDFNKNLVEARKQMVEAFQVGVQQAQSSHDKFYPDAGPTDQESDT